MKENSVSFEELIDLQMSTQVPTQLQVGSAPRADT